jgi:acyl dehydratase
MNADLLAYWQAIGAGDRDAAAAAKTSFDGAHRIADGGFRATLVAVLVALAAIPAALLPGTKARHGS